MVTRIRGLLAGMLILPTAIVCSPPVIPKALAQQRDAEAATQALNSGFGKDLPFADKTDFEEARRGFIATLPDAVINKSGGEAWTMKPYGFLDKEEAPSTVNPSLWRQARLNSIHGLFKVTERIYQIRGFDIANMTIVEGDTGLIIIDPLLVTETAKAGLDLFYQHRPRKPVVAVIYTHSHADHFGGVRGVVDEKDVKAGKIRIFAPSHFMDHAISENVIAGNAMSRRAWYQFGTFLTPGEKGQVDTGLGRRLSTGTLSLIAPTNSIKETFETHRIDGIEIEFRLTPETEAPAEMLLYFPQQRVLNMAEIATRNMHNLYTIRGAEVRDARAWSRYIADALDRWGDRTDIIIAQHHWPTFGKDRAASFLKRQRDLYKFIHDQTVRLMNHGYKPTEIAEVLKLPPSIANHFDTRGYYGTLSHNAKAVYQKYLGWYDANPANLSPLPTVEQARKTIDYMGGASAVLAKAREDFGKGEYRWVASIASQLVMADATNREARALAADAMEQLGYQAEAGTWRNAYLSGAMELRQGVPTGAATTSLSADMLAAIPVDLLFDFLGVRLNPDKAEGKTLIVNWTFTDTNEKVVLTLENSTLTQIPGKLADKADVSFRLNRTTLDAVLLKQRSFPMAILTGDVGFSGDPRKLGDLIAMLDEFTADFNIIEPLKARQ